MSLLDFITPQIARLSLARRAIDTLLNRVAARIFPALLVLIALVVFLWQMGLPKPSASQALSLRVWEQPESAATSDFNHALKNLEAAAPEISHETLLSRQPHWLALEASSEPSDADLVVEFPSRHLTTLSCWDRQNQTLLGSAQRGQEQGLMTQSQGGFALQLPGRRSVSLICQATFRGPARISAQASTTALHQKSQERYFKTGAMIEASLGMLAMFMLLTAIINRSRLYWTFVGWLLLNMRMASLSAGTDFTLFSLEIPPHLLMDMRQWTLCMYFAMSLAMFSLLFRKELELLRSGWPLTSLQAAALICIGVCPFVTYESMLKPLWGCTLITTFVVLTYLVRILYRQHSRMAYWYATSLAVTAIASLNEVLAASTGQRGLMAELNSVTAALASALLTSAALAEHMYRNRQEKIQAQKAVKAAYEDSPIGLFTVTDGEVITKANPAFQRMVQTFDPAQTLRLSQLFDPQTTDQLKALNSERQVVELQTQVASPDHPTPRWFAIKASTVDGQTLEGSLQDITDKVLATERLEFLVNHDPLTECLNARGLARSYGRSARDHSVLGYFDLDRFKLINDLYGHNAGDNVLKQVCQRIRSVLNANDILARVGGDEFVIIFANTTLQQAHGLAKQLIELISAQPYKIGRQSFALSISGGLVSTERFTDAPLKEIISAADALCRMAKKQPAERLMVMGANDPFLQHYKEELEVISCLERGETPAGLFLVMQPEISLTRPFQSLNFEVLVRLRKTDGSILPASVIIGAAEAHGKTAIIDRWVMTTAIEWLDAHLNELVNTRFASINLSGGSLNDEAFIAELFNLFERHPSALALTCIEITESVALTDMNNMQRFIDRVHALGGKVALDDFGAGYSSFGYLKDLSVDALKLDGSLVRSSVHSPSGLAIIEALGGLVSNLGMKSIGEYAEDLVTLKALVNAGIDYAQGYGISKPVLPERILQCRSAAEFIEDPEIQAYIQHIQTGADATLSLFGANDAKLH